MLHFYSTISLEWGSRDCFNVSHNFYPIPFETFLCIYNWTSLDLVHIGIFQALKQFDIHKAHKLSYIRIRMIRIVLEFLQKKKIMEIKVMRREMTDWFENGSDISSILYQVREMSTGLKSAVSTVGHMTRIILKTWWYPNLYSAQFYEFWLNSPFFLNFVHFTVVEPGFSSFLVH